MTATCNETYNETGAQVIKNSMVESMTETIYEMKTFNEFIEFAKSRHKFTRHDICECSSKRIHYWLNRAMRYNIIKEPEFHNYEYNQDILKSYEDFIKWLQNVDEFMLEEVPAPNRYSWSLQARREGILKQVDYGRWVKVSSS